MHSSQQNSFVRLPTQLLDALIQAQLSASQWRVLLWVLRYTYGWRRPWTLFTWYRIAQELLPAGHYQNPIVQEAIASRAAYLEANRHRLCAIDVYFVLVYGGTKRRQGIWEKASEFLCAPLATIRQGLSDEKQACALERELERARGILTHKVMTFIVQLPEALHAKALDKQQAFRFLRGLVNYAPYKAESVRLTYDRFVDFQLCDSALECYPDHLRLDDFHVEVLTLKEPPAQTFAHLLRGLEDIPCNVVICIEWKRQTSATMRGIIQSKRRHFHNKKSSLTASLSAASDSGAKGALTDHSAVAIIDELGSCLEEIELGGHTFGEFSITVVLYDEDRARVRRGAAECFKLFAAHDARLTEERYNILNSWLAVFPGNGVYNLRRLWLLDTNYADLSFLFAPYTGETENAHLGAEYLAVFETDHHTPFFFNLHYHDVAHTAIFGATGAGKSFLLEFLLTHLQKYVPLTIIFDLGGSYESLTRLFEGAYLTVGVEKQPFSINPFRLAPTPENLQFLFAFVKVLLESGTFRLSAQDEHDLFEQIKNLYVIEPDQRRLLTLANMLNRTLRVQLQKWVEGGPYAAVFDNVEDNLTFASFQTFDFQGMDRVPEVLQALLFFILHRANAVIDDPKNATTFKVFVCDEAWRFFRHPVIRQYIEEALKTWRKKNAAMILATQSSEDLLKSEMLPVVVESCPTKMFLANPGMDQKTYRELFHLNETEATRIAGLIPKQQILIKRPNISKVVNLRVSPKDYWLYSSNPYDRERRREAFERYGFKEGLEILAGLPTGRQGAQS